MADTSIDEEDNITADLIEQTPIEKCSLNPRRGRNSRRLLTGFIIYASEVRKQVVEQYPDQNFGFISKLVGDKWKECDKPLRFKYHQRALIHNKRIKELAAREGVSLGDIDLVSGSAIKAPKTSRKSKLSKLEKQAQKRLNDSSTSTTPNHDNKSSVSPETPISSSSSSSKRLNGTSSHNNDNSTPQSGGTANGTTKHQSTYSTRHNNHQNIQPTRSHSKKINTVDTSTQTPSIVYVNPPPKKPLTLSDAFLRHLEVLQRQQDEIVYKNLQQQQQQLQQPQQQQLS